MINTYLRKNHDGTWTDKTPDIPASINCEGEFVAVTRRYGAEADLGQALNSVRTRRGDKVNAALEVAKPFGIEFLAAKFGHLNEKLGLNAVIVPNSYQFDGCIYFEYDLRTNGCIYVCNVKSKKSKPVEISKVITELSKRKKN